VIFLDEYDYVTMSPILACCILLQLFCLGVTHVTKTPRVSALAQKTSRTPLLKEGWSYLELGMPIRHQSHISATLKAEP